MKLPTSKKERAFYFQGFLVIAYIGLRFMNGNLASFDPQFTTVMALLASYHVSQAVVDFKHGDSSNKQKEEVKKEV